MYRALTTVAMVSLVAGGMALAAEAPAVSLEVGGTPLYSPTLKSRAITAENPKGEPGQGGQAVGGRKGQPCLQSLKKDQVYTFAEIDGPGAVRHIWITVQNSGPKRMRNLILRFYWDGQETPSVEAPLSDFFGVCHGRTVPFESALVTMPEGRGFNSYILMPFGRKARLTVANETGEDAGPFFYQVDYTVGDPVTAETPRFHAQFRRVPHTTLRQDYVILDGVKGKGRYLGAIVGIVDRFAGKGLWWGEGELKIYLDGDDKFPTICGTGSEDYVGSGWGQGQFTMLNCGAPLIKDQFISYYRYHLLDPVYFSQDIKVTMQQIGWDGPQESEKVAEEKAKGWYRKDRPGGLFERVDDMCSTALWYQTLPTQAFPPFPDRELRSLNLVTPTTSPKP